MRGRLFGLGLVIVCLPVAGLAQSDPPKTLPGTVIPLPQPNPASQAQPTAPLPGTVIPQPGPVAQAQPTTPPTTPGPLPPTYRRPQALPGAVAPFDEVRTSPTGQPPYPTQPLPGIGPTASSTAWGPGHWHYTGYQYGPRVAPEWWYQGLGSERPYVDYPWGMPGYSGRSAWYGKHGLGLWGPAVPVYAPLPTLLNPDAAVYPHRNVNSPGFWYGWRGPWAATSRPRNVTASVWADGVPASRIPLWGGAQREATGLGTTPIQTTPVLRTPKGTGGCLSVSVKLPDATAEVFVNGVKTTQSGVERLYDSPEMETGKEVRYEFTVRWLEAGLPQMRTKAVIGTSGEVVEVDFTTTDVTVVRK